MAAEKTLEAEKKSKMLRVDIQHFAGNGDGNDGGDNGDNSGNDGGNGNGGNADNKGDDSRSTEALEKLVQSKVDRLMAEERKKNADLQKRLDKLNKEKLTDDELKQAEIAEREKAIADKERALAEKENRLYAIKAIKTAGLDDGGETSLELVDFVMSDTEENIDTKVKSFKTLVDKMVSARVDATFKANGRNPNGANDSGDSGDDKNATIAEKLGKSRAEQNKKSNDILSHYLGGKQ